MKEVKQAAHLYLNAGYSIFPVKEDKTPTLDWGKYSVEKMKVSDINNLFDNPAAKGLALATGFNNVTCIDVDCKYDLSGSLFGDLCHLIHPELLSKMVINKTVNNGFHLLFRCTKVEGSMKLASRATTPKEKLDTFKEQLGELGLDSIDIALSSSLNDKSRVLIETRGLGGYCLVPPSKGYSRVGGKIQDITVEEYDEVMEICRSFNTYIRPVANFISRKGSLGSENIFANINKNFEVLPYLEKQGWTSVGVTYHGYHKIKRPGKTTNPHSAYFDPEKNIFWCFSTSAGFEMNKSYSAVDLILYFEYDDNKERLPELRAKFIDYED